MLCLRNIVDKSFAHVYVYLPSIGENCSIIHSEINILLTKFVPFLFLFFFDKSFAHVYVYLPSIGENCSIIHSEINILLTKFVPFKLEGVS